MKSVWLWRCLTKPGSCQKETSTTSRTQSEMQIGPVLVGVHLGTIEKVSEPATISFTKRVDQRPAQAERSPGGQAWSTMDGLSVETGWTTHGQFGFNSNRPRTFLEGWRFCGSLQRSLQPCSDRLHALPLFFEVQGQSCIYRSTCWQARCWHTSRWHTSELGPWPFSFRALRFVCKASHAQLQRSGGTGPVPGLSRVDRYIGLPTVA